MSPIRPRAALSSLPDYVAGKPPRTLEGVAPYKLSSNENPFGPVPAALEAIAQAASSANRYPDPTAGRLREAISRATGVPAEDVVAGAGSLGALMQILAAFAGDGDEVVYAWRSFEAYPILVGLAGARSVQVPNLPDGSHDLEGMLAAVTERTRVLLLCSPNNPTGPSLTQRQVDDLLTRLPEHVLVVVDEAYLEFQRLDGLVDGAASLRRDPRVVALRTFSKAHGLAGLRVGYSLSAPEVTAALRKSATTFAVTEIAQAAAIASLSSPEQVAERVEQVVVQRERMLQGLAQLGWEVPRSQANFVWLPLGEQSVRFAETCGEQALSVRAFAGDGVRVSAGEPEAVDRFLEICSTFPR